MSSAGGRPSWQAMVSVRTSIVPPGPRPPPADTPDESPAVTTSQVTPSIQDFAVSLGREPTCDMRFDDPYVSRTYTALRRRENASTLKTSAPSLVRW